MTSSETMTNLIKALHGFQSEVPAVPRDVTGQVAQRLYQYADLSGILRTIQPFMAKHGLAVVQLPTVDGQIVTVETVLMHTSGEWISNILTITGKDSAAQTIGSVITYGRRYALGAILGIATEEDDDGKTAGEKHQPRNQQEAAGELSKRTAPPAKQEQKPPAKPVPEPVHEDPNTLTPAELTDLTSTIQKSAIINEMQDDGSMKPVPITTDNIKAIIRAVMGENIFNPKTGKVNFAAMNRESAAKLKEFFSSGNWQQTAIDIGVLK